MKTEVRCPHCAGEGKVFREIPTGLLYPSMQTIRLTCTACKGTGKTIPNEHDIKGAT